MRVALTGVSGFLGSVIARHLHAAGHAVTGLVRDTSRRDHLEGVVDRFVVGGQDDESAWEELLADADAVVHNSFDWKALKAGDTDRHMASNLLGSLRLLQASAPRPFVFMSTIAVHHDMRPRWGGVIDEDHPMRPGTLYGAAKASVEVHLWADHLGNGRHTCALRPCAVYGIDPALERSIGFPIVRDVRSGARYRRPGGGKFVHVDDVAEATIAGLRPEASGSVLNLVDCYARWSDWARIIAEELGIDAEVDDSSPPSPRNSFDVSAARALGVAMDRGHEGIRAHVRELIPLVPEG